MVIKSIQMTLPWSEQKKPCLHLGQDSFEDELVAGAAVGGENGFFGVGVGVAFANTGFSVVCLPVLHLHHRKKTFEWPTLIDI